MKKLLLILVFTLFLSGCSVFERGNYDKDRTGYVLSENMLVSYHTNTIGEIDIFMIDQVFSYLEALEYVSFDNEYLSTESIVTISELDSCGIESEIDVPKYLRIGERTYYLNVTDSGSCSYDEYDFTIGELVDDEYSFFTVTDSPVVDLDVTLFKKIDFKVNTFDTTVFIENIEFDEDFNKWEKTIVTPLPMSKKQAGNMYEDNTSFVNEVTVLERYVLLNQSINLLHLREGYESEDVNNIWSDDTIDRLGRDHDVIKTVRIKETGEILIIIKDTLSRLGMFS